MLILQKNKTRYIYEYANEENHSIAIESDFFIYGYERRRTLQI